jgi:hypothetical protein
MAEQEREIPEICKTERGSEGPGLTLSAGEHTVFVLRPNL